MAWDTGTKDVTTSAAQVEISARELDRRVKTVEFFARSGNGGAIYVGPTDSVAIDDGRELVAGATMTVNFETGSELWSKFFAIAGSGSPTLLDWTLVFED